MSIEQEIKKSFPKIKELFDEQSFYEFINCDPDELCLYHFGLGTWIRNHLLYKNSDLLKAFQSEGFFDKDDMSAQIIELFYRDNK